MAPAPPLEAPAPSPCEAPTPSPAKRRFLPLRTADGGADASRGICAAVRQLSGGWSAEEFGQARLDDVEGVMHEFVGDRQRRQEAQNVAVGARGEHDDAVLRTVVGDLLDQIRVRLDRVVLDELGGDHRTAAADVTDLRVLRLQLRQPVDEDLTDVL